MTDQPEKPRRVSMLRATSLAIFAASHIIGWDLAREPDRTGYWPRQPKPAPNPAKRAQIKAARKQRNRKP